MLFGTTADVRSWRKADVRQNANVCYVPNYCRSKRAFPQGASHPSEPSSPAKNWTATGF